MPLFLNQSMDDLLSVSNSLISSFMSVFSSYIVLSTAKFTSLTSLMNINKPLMKILNKVGPNMEPCGTPD